MSEDTFSIIETHLTDSMTKIVMESDSGKEKLPQRIVIEMNTKTDDSVAPLAIVHLAALHAAQSAISAKMTHYGHLLSQNPEVLRQQDAELVKQYLPFQTRL